MSIMIFCSMLSFSSPKGVIFEKRCQNTQPLSRKLHLYDNLSGSQVQKCLCLHCEILSVFSTADTCILKQSWGVLSSQAIWESLYPFLYFTKGPRSCTNLISEHPLSLGKSECSEISLGRFAILKENRNCTYGSHIRDFNILIHLGWKKKKGKNESLHNGFDTS